MSNSSFIRDEKNCLNCGAEVKGKYCSDCGQLNRVPQMKLVDLMHDAIHATLHFDGSFFNTIKLLARYPGELTKEYLAGRRSRYLPPIQLYLFTSAIFFFFLNTFFIENNSSDISLTLSSQKNSKDSIAFDLGNNSLRYSSIESYEKKQQELTSEKRDGKISQYFTKQEIRLNKKFRENPKKAFFELIDNFIHSFSSLFFISMPLIALWLNLIFYQKKSINFVGHFIFIAHNYIFAYIAIFIQLTLDKLGSIKGLGLLSSLSPLIFIWIFYYGYKSTKSFYGLTRGKSLIYFSFALFGSLLIFSALFLFYLIVSLIKTQ